MSLDVKTNINVLSYAVEPGTASSPNKQGIIILSLIAGICVGVLSAITTEIFTRVKKV